jgi:ATP-dependent Lon protease
MRQLRAINAHAAVAKPYRMMLIESGMPIQYKASVMQKLNTFEQMSRGDSEYLKLKTMIDTFMRIPFGIYRSLAVTMRDGPVACRDFICNAKQTLDDCVYGMNDAKMQILQFLGQWISNPSAIGSAIAIHGPPGTGKTSIVKDGVSRILGREFAFVSLGGASDSSMIEGHSYTYEGSTWGRIVQILVDSKCMNPVIFFDELDKISATNKGEEIVNALIHLTDTTQNAQFHDKYFADIDFDVSKCLFVFSYNDDSRVNPVLKDRMYRIKTAGYTAAEKIVIARKHLLPKICAQVGFADTDVVVPDDVLTYLATNTRFTQGESGVRALKRCLEIIHTKLNLVRLVGGDMDVLGKTGRAEFPRTVTRADVDALVTADAAGDNQSLLSMYV